MAENFMSKPKSVVPQTKKIYGKATFKGIKPKIPKAKEQAEPIENAPTLKEVEAKIEQHIDKVEAEIRQQSSVDEPMVGQCPHPSAEESLEKEVKIDVNIIVEYGSRIPDVAFEIQNRVKKAVESMTGLTVPEVNVHVQGVNTEIQEKKNEEPDKKSEE